MFPYLALDVLLLAALALIGGLAARVILRHVRLIEVLCLSFPLGAGLFSFILFLLSWAGMRLTLVAALLTLLASAAILLGLIRGREGLADQPRTGADPGSVAGPAGRVGLSLVALVVLSAFLLSIAQSYMTWDAIAIWSAKGYGIAKEGTIFAGQEWGAHGLAYPLNIPILVSLFKMMDGDLLPGSKMIFPAFYGSLVAGCFFFLGRRGLGSTIATAGALFVASLPAVYEYGTNGYANLPFSCYLVLGALLQIEALLGNEPRELIVSSILYGLSCWTRPEGVFMVPIVVLAVFLGARIPLKQWARLGVRLAPVLAIAGPWLLFSRLHPTEGQMTQTVVALRHAIAAGQWNPSAFYWIARYAVRQAISPSSWGVLVLLFAAAAVLRLTKSRPWLHHSEEMVMAAALGAGSSIVGFYYLVSFIGDLPFWLGTGVDRMFLPAGLLIAVLAVLLAGAPGPTGQIPASINPHSLVQ